MASTKALISRSFNHDRISDLPDGILCHVLSFLPTKYSVRTRVLSKRWKYLFSFVPFLDLEYSSVKSTPASSFFFNHSVKRKISSKSFVDFVNRVFFEYKVPKMKKFRLIHTKKFLDEDCDLVTWISIAVCRCVLELEVAVLLRPSQTLPRHVFVSETLIILKIEGSFRIMLPTTVSLPCLKTCHLVGVNLHGDTAQRLFRSCPVLEDLMLIKCCMRDVQSLEISGVTLKRFVIHEHGTAYQLVLDAPNLLSFEYVGCFAYVGHAILGVSKGEFLRLLVNRVCHVETLSVCAFLVQAFQHSSHSLPKFPNLTLLKLGLNSTLGLQSVLDFLDRSPQLEVLVLIKDLGNKSNELEENTYPWHEHVPTCVSKHIKEIEVRSFSMLEHDLKLVEYMLKNALVLEKLKIQHKLSCEAEVEFSKKVLVFPKSSTACEIVFEKVDME